MSRLAKKPLKVFHLNMMKARGLARLQFYLDDFLTTGGERTLKRFQDFMNEMISLMFGFGFDEITKAIQPTIEQFFADRFGDLTEEQMQNEGDVLAERLEPHIASMKEFFEEVDLLRSRVLLEQAVVASVTAFEVFVHDITVSGVKLNPFIEVRFFQELGEKVEYKTLRDAGYEGREAIGLAVARTIQFGDPGRIRQHFKRMLDRDIILDTSKDRKELRRILAYRNLIAHRSGIVDQKFREQTGYPGQTGEPVRISKNLVERWIDLLSRIAGHIDESIRETKPPRR